MHRNNPFRGVGWAHKQLATVGGVSRQSQQLTQLVPTTTTTASGRLQCM